jgi:hypothetical protein
MYRESEAMVFLQFDSWQNPFEEGHWDRANGAPDAAPVLPPLWGGSGKSGRKLC